MGNSNRKYQIQPRSVTLTRMNDPRYLQYNYQDDDSYDVDRERIRLQLIDNTLVDTIRDGVNIVLQVDDDDDELTKELYDLLKDTKEDLIRLDYEDDHELHELLIQLSQTIRIVAQSDNDNLDNFINNFNSMNQIQDFLP
tara:strand:+ start:78 stop:497 length:420 start_codon:yes stop_codon:yes gene_type:complete